MHRPGRAKPHNPALSIARELVSRAFFGNTPHSISHGQLIRSVGDGLEMDWRQPRKRLFPPNEPADQNARHEADGECGYNCFRGVPLNPQSCVVQKLFSGIVKLFSGTPQHANSIFCCFGNGIR